MAINLGRWFRDRKKQAEGVVAQANPFDGGKTYNTVINNTPVAKPVQTQVNTAQPGWSVRTQPTQPSWLQKQNDFNTSLSAITAPKPQVAQTPKAQEPNLLQQRIDKSYGTGFTATKNRLRDVLDGNTEADRIRRMANTGLNESYKQQQDRLTQVAINSSPKRSGANQFSAGALSGVTDFFGKAAGSAAELQGRIGSIENPIARTAVKLVTPGGAATLFQSKDQAKRQFNTGKQMNEFVENKKQQSGIGARKDDNKWLYGGGQVAGQLPAQIATGGVGLLNTGAQMAASEANKAQAKGKTNEQALGIGLAQGVLSAASEKIGIDKFLPGSGGSNAIINAIKRFGTEGLQEAQQQFTQNLVANKTYEPTQSLKEGVGESFVLGGVAGSAMSPFADIGVNNKPQRPEYSPTPQDIEVMKDLSEMQMNPAAYSPREQQILATEALEIKRRGGPDLVSGSRSDINETAGATIENFQNTQPEFNRITTAPVNQLPDAPSMVARIRAAKERVLNPVPMNEGGKAMSVDPLESLKQEARKYKSAEEFVNSQIKNTYLSKYGDGALNPMELPSLHQSNIYANKAPNGADLEVYSMRNVDNFRHLSGKSEYNSNTRQLKTYRVVPSSGESVQPGDFVFDNKAAAEKYLLEHPERGNKIVSVSGSFDDFLSPEAIQSRVETPSKTGELIYAPKSKRGILTDLYNQAHAEAKAQTPNESTKRPIKPAPAKPLSVVDRVNSINETPKAPTKDKVLASLEKQQLTDLYNQATQPPKSTQAKPPTPFEQNLQTAGLAPNTPQRQVVRNTAPAALDSQGYNPNQSQSASNSQPPQTSPVVRSSETQQQAPLQGKTGNTQVTQNSQSLTSSDNIIDLKTIDVNDPFKNNSLAQKFRNEFGKYFIDEDTEMINLLKRIEKETKSKDLVEQWLQDTDLVRASNSIANSKLRNNQNLSNALNGMSKKDMADFDRYAAARSELSNVQRGLTSTSKSIAELQETVNDLGGKFGERFNSLNSFYNDLSNDLFEAGIIDATTRDKWAQNKDYIRVQRDMEDLLAPQVGRGRSRSFGTTSTSKKRTGSQREILSSTQSALKRAQEIQLEIQRNKAANNIIDVLEKYGLAEQIPSTQTTNKNVIKRFKDGKVQYFETSKDVKRVIDSVNPIQLGVIAKVISAPTRLFRAGTTALSAPFAVTNYARDQLSSGVFSKDIKATHNPKSVVSGLYGALKDFGGVQNDPLWKKFEQIAGDQTIFDELRNAKNSKKLLTEIRRGGGFKARGAELINPLNTVRNLEDLIGVTEKSTRFQNFKGIYEKAKRQGVSEDVAIRKATQAALQNSVNFSRAGQVTRIANLMFPYFNAGIQGSRNVGRSLRDRPVATTAKAVTLIGIPSIAAVLYNYEDEERKKIYENIPETEKENGFVFVLPGAKQREDGTYEGLIKIPKPQGYRELTDPIRVVAERFAGAEDSKSVAEMMKDMIPAFSGPLQTSDMNKFTSTFVPQMVKPALQAHLNKDLYWGSDTVPEYMVEGTDDATKRAYRSTSGMARFIADQLKVSPIQVEKAIIDTTGALGRYGVNAVDTALAKAGKIPEEQIGGRSIKSDFSRRMFEARGIEKEEKNMSDGQKYFKAVKAATANMKPQEKTAWDSYNQSNKNFLGEVIYDKNSQAKKQAKAAAYIDHPGLFQTDKKIDAEARKRGEPGNPLYDLTYQQALMVVQQKALPPGAKDEGLNTLYDQPWYQKFKNDEDKFYEQIFAGKEDAQDNPYPTRSPELTKAMDYYYNLPSSYAKSQFKKANPGIAEQMEAYAESKRNWTNTERAKIGLPPIVEGAKYAKSGGSGGKRGGGRGRKSSFSMADFTTNPQLQTQTYQNLNKLLAGTTFKGGKKPSKTGKSGKVAQKQIKVNMKA